MKKRIFYITTIIVVFIAIIKTSFFYNKDINSHTISYTGAIYNNNNIILLNTLSGSIIDQNYDIMHQISFHEKSKKLIDLTIQQKSLGEKKYFTLYDYTISNKKANHRLDVFGKTILNNNKNKEIAITDTGFSYKTSTIPGLLQDTIRVEGSYTNQIQETNKFTIIVQQYCGIGQYFKKKYGCDIKGEIHMILPIKENKINRIIKGALEKSIL